MKTSQCRDLLRVDLDCEQARCGDRELELSPMLYRCLAAPALRFGKKIPADHYFRMVWKTQPRDNDCFLTVSNRIRRAKYLLNKALAGCPGLRLATGHWHVWLTAAVPPEICFGLNGLVMDKETDPLFWGIDLKSLFSGAHGPGPRQGGRVR